MSDKTLVCQECGQEFTFSADEQQFFNERGFQEPKRCKPCRDKRKRDRRGGRGFGGPGRGYNR
ncbi:MAG: zinc-ribbon domain containing protein [bacterium]